MLTVIACPNTDTYFVMQHISLFPSAFKVLRKCMLGDQSLCTSQLDLRTSMRSWVVTRFTVESEPGPCLRLFRWH